MFVQACPKCGRRPKIDGCVPAKDGTRRRICYCPKLCTFIRGEYGPRFSFVFRGDGDDNTIYSIWNKYVEWYLDHADDFWSSSDVAVIDARVED